MEYRIKTESEVKKLSDEQLEAEIAWANFYLVEGANNSFPARRDYYELVRKELLSRLNAYEDAIK